MQFQAKYQAYPVGSHEAKIKSHPVGASQKMTQDEWGGKGILEDCYLRIAPYFL